MLRAALPWGLLLIAGLMTSPSTPAGDWPRFRGPNGSGISTDAAPIEFGEQQNRLWKVEIPGFGNSSPISGGGRIFLQTATSDGNERLLMCLDLESGKALWSRKAPGTTARTHQKNTLASCTAATDGKRVFMPFWNGKELSLIAYDFDGELLWSKELGPFAGEHGAGHSPILWDGKVIFAFDHDGSAEVLAFDAQTGAELWRTPRTPFKSCYSTPLIYEAPGAAPEIVVASTAGIAGYDPTTGSEIWNWPWTSNAVHLRTVGSPIASQGMVFFSAGNGPGDRHAVALRLGGKGSLNDAHLAWETKKVLPYVPCMLARGDHVYFVNDAGIAGCVLARTGDTVWTRRLGGGPVTASPLMASGNIYSFSEKGEITVFAAEPKYKELATTKLDEGIMASPAVADGKLIIRGKQHLYCFGTPSR